MCREETETVDYGVVMQGGVEVFNEVNEVGGYVVIGKNLPASVVGTEVKALLRSRWRW